MNGGFLILLALVLCNDLWCVSAQQDEAGEVDAAAETEDDKVEKDLNYVVGILKEAPAKPSKGRKTVQMTAQSGRKFTCIIPDPNAPPAKEEEQEEEAVPVVTLESTTKKMRKAFSKACFTLNQGWWNYEACPFRFTSQYHGTNAARESEFSLGKYVSDGLDSEDNYFQTFQGGTEGRKTTVRFLCQTGAEGPHAFESVTEPTLLAYDIVIRTSLACSAHKKGKETLDTLLSPMTKNCIFLNTGWWTYKYCHLEGVTQFHREQTKDGQGNPVVQDTSTYDLGRKSNRVLALVEDALKPYASVRYTDGTVCDLTGQPRKSEVRFVCDVGIQGAIIDQIAEPASCEYILTVSTNHLCTHEKFTPNLPAVHEITCFPSEP